jgi:hypothetical protein
MFGRTLFPYGPTCRLISLLCQDDFLFNADINDAYCHLRLRETYQIYLSFRVSGINYIPACQNLGLLVSPWCFTKAMRPVVAHLHTMGNRVYSYLDDIFGAPETAIEDKPSTEPEDKQAGRAISLLLRRLCLWLHPTKSDLSGKRRLEILGILVDTRRTMFLLSTGKLRKVETAALHLLVPAAAHRRHVSARAICSFTELGNSTNLAVFVAKCSPRKFSLVDPHQTHPIWPISPPRHPIE